MKAKWFASAFLIAPVCGCTEDMEHLKAIGAKLANRTPQAEKLGKMPWSDTARQLHSAISKSPLVHRVSYRLQFDKDLAEEQVATELKGPGQIELTGYVSSENHRERAGEIASRTLGVEEVVNNLKVGKPEPASPGEQSKSESNPPQSPNKETGTKPAPETPPAGPPASEKGNPNPETKSTPQPGPSPVAEPNGRSPGANPGNRPTNPSDLPAVPGSPTLGKPSPTGIPVTIPPAPEKNNPR